MTYCLGIRLKEGLVALSDTRITSGSQTVTAKKYKIYSKNGYHVFLMTSGLRSVRDKTLTYFSEIMEEKLDNMKHMYEVANAFGDQIKRVAAEDKHALEECGMDFNINTIMGGKLEGDKEQKLYMIYPQGNWIEIGKGYPFTIIGNSGYGTPVLRRTINFYDSSIRFALKTGFLSFDSTRVSSNDVGYPLDVIVYPNDSKELIVTRIEESDIANISQLWGEKLTQAVLEIPDDWTENLIPKKTE
jgi:putative proteasome-type protease